MVAGPLFMLTVLIAGATRAGYDPLRHPASSLALGPGGWVQTVNFLAAGVLTLCFAFGLRRTAGTWRAVPVAIWGISLLGAGVFITDPVSGYPAGTPPLPDPPTTTGMLHDFLSLPGFIAILVAVLVLARGRGRAWAAYSVATAAVFLAAFVLCDMGFAQVDGYVEVGGLFQRIAVGAGWGWLTILAYLTYSAAGPSDPAVSPRREVSR